MDDERLRKLLEQQETLRLIVEGPLRFMRENDAVMLRLQDLLAVDTAALSLQFSPNFQRFNEVTAAAVSRLATLETTTAMQQFADQQRQLVEAFDRVMLPSRSIADQMHLMVGLVDATRIAANSIDARRIGYLVDVAQQQRDVVAMVSDRLSLRHASLIASLSTVEGQLASLPPFVSELPAVDLFVHTQALRSVTPHEALAPDAQKNTESLRADVVSETAEYLEITLPQLNPAFLNQYRAARAVEARRGPDWWTHGSASLRKLLKGVLHTAAPNQRVLPWALKNNKPVDSVGRPTRACKIEWLCASIPNDAYRAYIRTELNSALALIDLLDNAQHVDEFPEFEEQYVWTVTRIEVAVRQILRIWEERDNAE